ncbi:MAG TPA: response regulator [Sphingobacteriaceae bacterium]
MSVLILLIEDNKDICESVTEILELENFKVVSADNGVSGIKMIEEHRPDMILCDIYMPDMDGYTVCGLVKDNPETAEIPFIFLTAKAEQKDREKALLLGCDDYLVKPFDNVKLLDTIRSCFDRKGKVY